MNDSCIYELIGFEADGQLISHLTQALNRLDELAPYDSILRCRVQKEGDNYHVELRVISGVGTFEGEAASQNVEEAIDVAEFLAEEQIHLWKRRRFGSPLDFAC